MVEDTENLIFGIDEPRNFLSERKVFEANNSIKEILEYALALSKINLWQNKVI